MFPEFEYPVRAHEKHYSLVLYILDNIFGFGGNRASGRCSRIRLFCPVRAVSGKHAVKKTPTILITRA